VITRYQLVDRGVSVSLFFTHRKNLAKPNDCKRRHKTRSSTFCMILPGVFTQ
jgi:hypothetical protein